MIHTPTSERIRLAAAKTILPQIAPGFSPQGSYLFLRNAPTVASSATATIVLTRAMTQPWILRAFWCYSDIDSSVALDCDLLISHDALTDAAAAIRDWRPGGGVFSGGNFIPNTTPTRYAFGLEVRRWRSFIKTLFRNQTGANRNFVTVVEVELA